jgi:hypothetical protein
MKSPMSLLFAALLVTAGIAQFAGAAECLLSIDRTPCAGKEAEARKPYGGKNPTDEKTKAKDGEACLKDAEKAAKIIRKGTLTKKVVAAKFDGKDLGSKEDSVACK